MKYKLLRLSLLSVLALLCGGGILAVGHALSKANEDDTVTAQWDWKTGTPATLSSVHIEGSTGSVASDVDGINLYVDATNGKLKTNGDNVQCNDGTILRVPVISIKDVVTIYGYPGLSKYTIDGGDVLQNENNYTATSFDVSRGYVEVVSKGGYLYGIKVVQNKTAAATAFKNFSVQMTDSWVDNNVNTFFVKVAADGTPSVVADEADATFKWSAARWNDPQHGWVNPTITVKVDGPVKIGLGNCKYGSQAAKITDAAGNVTQFQVGTSNCWDKNDIAGTTTYGYYKGTEPTTLTIFIDGYAPYLSVEAANPADLKDEATVSFGAGEATGAVVPASIKDEVGKTITLPKNFTMYVEGKTLTGWSDGTETFAPGATYTIPEADIELQPVFTENTVSLADRTEEVTLKWTFRKDEGAPVLNYQNKDGFLVTQATIGDQTIDVKLSFTTNNGGKLNNVNNTDCAQCNNNTTFTIPSCKNAVVTMVSYGGNYIFKADGKTATTVDSQSDYAAGQTLNYTIANTAETIDIVMGNDAGYVRYIQVVLPVVQSAGGESYDNKEITIEFPFDDTADLSKHTTTVNDVISVAASDFTPTDATISTGSRSKDPDNGLQFITFTGNKPILHWNVKPAAGLTFTPTQIKMYVQRFGTDIKEGVTVSARVGENGETQTFGTWTARRANWTTDDENKKFGWTEAPATLVNEIVINLTEAQQSALASEDGLHIYATTNANNKAAGFADIRISGTINGTKAAVDKYALSIAASPEEGGSVSAYPAADEYEAGTEVTLTATEKFGYDFVNWTNAAGDVVSTEAKFKYTMDADATLTANFKKVNTYELALTIDGTNDYMVTVSPAPTVVDGKNMYEEGAAVVLTANQYEGLVTFNNWSDGTTNSTLNVTMDGNKTITAVYSEADIIAGWDFYKAGNNGRNADFSSEDNESAALSLVKTDDGTTSGWLDKSTIAGGGYEGLKGAAVNWRTGASNGDVGHYHWQTKINAESFKSIKVQFQMLYNYNAYQKYNAEYSLDGEKWINFGSITMTGAKAPASFSESLPEACDNQKDLYIRLIADKTSSVDGTASANDGNALAMFFITGTAELINDGAAPVLVSTVPAEGAEGASASGKIVLTFDEKVKVADGTTATLGDLTLTPVVSGKTVTFAYKNLDYATNYTFTLAGNKVADLTDNYLSEAITINFKTMERPTVAPTPYDVEVSTVEELLAAINTANTRADQNTRFRIFIKKGTYTIPLGSTMKTVNGFEVPECITFISGKNISFIGEDRDETIITNAIPADATFAGTYGTTSKYDGIGNSDVFQIQSSASGLYWQDLTVMTGMEDARGRDIAIQDKGTKNIYKNVCLHGYQDTWTSNNDNGLYYFEGGVVRGRTDYLCGKGDIFFNGVELRQIAGGYAAVPSKPANIGWVFKDCVINGDGEGVDGNYTLGRPWGSGTPVALFIDTRMNVKPSAIGWNEMSGGWPARFAEYNSMTATGSVIDLSGRKQWFGEQTDKNGNITVEAKHNDPVLTAAEAATYSDMTAMFGDWQPALLTEQAPLVSNVKIDGNTLSWTGNNYSLLYAVCINGEVVAFTTETSIDVTTLTVPAAARRAGTDPVYSVRAANEMGGLNEAVEATDATGISAIETSIDLKNAVIYDLQGRRVLNPAKGLYIVNGKKMIIK